MGQIIHSRKLGLVTFLPLKELTCCKKSENSYGGMYIKDQLGTQNYQKKALRCTLSFKKTPTIFSPMSHRKGLSGDHSFKPDTGPVQNLKHISSDNVVGIYHFILFHSRWFPKLNSWGRMTS